MSKIEELLEELCPEGVEWKSLGEVGEFVRGNGLQKSDFTDSGIGCIHYGQIYTYYGNHTDSTKSFVSPVLAGKLKKVKRGDVIFTNTSENIEDVCKAVAWLGNDDIVTGGHASIFKHKENPKFIAYYTQTEIFSKAKRKYAKGTKVTDVSAKDLSKILVPVPPLPIQEEIVKILDSFTALEAELEAELEARSAQYEYYRNKLLDFEGKDVEWMCLEEVCININAGGDVPSKHLKGLKPTEEFPYPIFANAVEYKGLYGYADSYKIGSDAVTISARGAKVGFHTVRAGKFTPIIRLITLVPNKLLITTRFLNYILDITPVSGTKGGIPQLTVPTVKKISIPVPNLEEQERIVKILDQFDALVNDISQGLPAEITARRQQYEYYRNKLLTFKPKLNERV